MEGRTAAPATTASKAITAANKTTAVEGTTAAETTAATTIRVTTTVIIPAEVRSEVTVSVKLTSESFKPALKDKTTSAYKELRAEVIKTVSALHFALHFG